MEMWCPDDIGRDSWDWVGPPAWGRTCFNSPEWGGSSSPVKTEPPQIVLLLLLLCCCVVVVLLLCCCCVVVVVVVVVFDAIFQTECVCPHTLSMKLCRSPRALTGVSARGLRKLALDSGTTGGARKMTQNASKNPFTAAIPNTAGSCVPVSVAQRECPRLCR